MSAVPSAIGAAPAVKPPRPMIVLVRGRIASTVVRDQSRFTKIATPAPDEYSHPQVVEIRSPRTWTPGQVGDDIAVTAQLGGWERRFDYQDRDSGQQRKGSQVNHTLDLVE